MADNTARSSKMYWGRVAVLVLALIWCAVGGGLAVGAFVDLKNKINAGKQSLDPATVAFLNALNVNNLYIPGLLSAVPALLIAFTALCALLAMGWAYYRRKRDNGEDTIASEAVIILLMNVWLLIALIVETVYFATKLPTNVVIVINGHVAKTRSQFGLAKDSIIVLWFAWLFSLICIIVLFIASSQATSTTKNKPLTPSEIEEMRRKDRANPDYEHLARPLDPDEKVKAQASPGAGAGAGGVGAPPGTASTMVDPTGPNAMTEKTFASTSAAN